MTMRKILYSVVASATVALLGGACYAQNGAAQFPARAIRLIVPFPPGGSDTVARLVARRMSESLGQQIVVDNRPGAAGVIGTHLASQATPDGHTIVFITASLTITPATTRLPYDLTRDFAAIAPVATGPLVLVVHPSVPAKTVSELVALSKSKPNALNYASSGAGSITHLTAELFRSMTGADLTHVPFKGTGPAQNELLAGRVQAMFGVLAPALPHVQAGKLRALGVTSAVRSKLAPNVPTISEAGVKGYESATWYGMLAPARTPASVVQTLSKHVAAAVADTELSEKLTAIGFEPLGPMSPAQFGRYVAAEIAKWSKLIKQTGMELQK
ncbi:MAG TPA: tripartite tricarboxylate transporter substrate binding protein [Burkholderiales bacterium]|nr:tripartite tricarboxylate transporter substrate binding protein [Burkholderiales bacterium]